MEDSSRFGEKQFDTRVSSTIDLCKFYERINMSDPVKGRWGLMYTMNLGNFQSLKVEFSLEDSAREGETAKQMSDRVYQFVETELMKKIKEAQKELEG